MNPDPLRYYDLESYLLSEVRNRFESEGSIGAFDFFSIVIWKANRAKSRIANRLREKDPQHRTALEPIVQDLTRSLHDADDGQARLRILVDEWGFMLPMATAILSILWPDEFTVYDVRVCGELKDFNDLDNLGKFHKKWTRYCEYRDAVRAAVPQIISLRDKDRYLWARSAIRQLAEDIAAGFVRRSDA
jgi:hypothetical protein